jgi:hypothetical protein
MFLITCLGFSGTRWMCDKLLECGLDVGHEGWHEGCDGVIGGAQFFFKLSKFNPVVQQVRHPLSYANSLAVHWADHLAFDERYRTHFQEPGIDIPMGYDRIYVEGIMVWYNAMSMIDGHPKIQCVYRVEDMQGLGEPFRQLLTTLGYDPDSIELPDSEEWKLEYSHNPHLPPPWERDFDLEWPDLSDYPHLEAKQEQCKELARKYGYKV